MGWGGVDAGQKNIMTVLFFFSVFLFAQKQSIYSSVLQHKYIRKELYYILLGTKKNVMEAELDRLSTSAVRIDLFNISSTAMSQASRTQRYKGTPGGAAGCVQPPRLSWLSQNQTVKCTLLLSINREATLTKKIQW